MTDPTLEPPPTAVSGWPVWGHDHAVRELQAAAGRPRHAYILSGYDGVGKRTLSSVFAQALVCREPNAPCGHCSACRRVRRGTHPDVSVYDIARQTLESDKATAGKNLSLTIDTVRSISANISLRPVEASHRVIIVDDVETMQEAAQEAFLKTLEEPPSYAVILLLTTDSELLLETIRSRAMTIQLQTVRADIIVAMLEAMGADNDRAEHIAGAALGRPGWAVRALRDPAVMAERLDLHQSVVSWIEGDQFHRLAEAMRLGDGFTKDRAAVFARLTAAQAIWRATLLHIVGIAGIQADVVGRNATQPISPEQALSALESVTHCLSQLDANVRPKLALQTMVLQWPTI